MPIPLDRDWQCARCDRNYAWTDLTWMEQHVWFQFQRHGPWPGSWIARGPWHRLDVKVCADCAEFVHRSYWRTTDGLVLGCSCYFISFESRGAHFYNTMAGGWLLTFAGHGIRIYTPLVSTHRHFFASVHKNRSSALACTCTCASVHFHIRHAQTLLTACSPNNDHAAKQCSTPGNAHLPISRPLPKALQFYNTYALFSTQD